MADLLMVPGIPYFLGALAGAALAAMGVLGMIRQRSTAPGGGGGATTTDLRSSMLVGQLTGGVIVLMVVLLVLVSGVQGHARLLLLVGGSAAYLYVGVVIPRRPIVAQQQAAATIRRLTPGFISFVRVALNSFESPLDIMRRYTARPVERWAPMQQLVAESIALGLDQRLRPFAALATIARQRGCRELIDVAEALAQAEAEGGRIDTVLEAQQTTLELILQSEFKRMLRRRTLYLLVMVAVSLVIGILANLLFTMVVGSGVLF